MAFEDGYTRNDGDRSGLYKNNASQTFQAGNEKKGEDPDHAHFREIKDCEKRASVEKLL